jgi:CheY-like chemotaxis protein
MNSFRVLIVEDETSLQEVYEQTLLGLGVEVQLASDGKEALEWCTKKKLTSF